MFYRPIDICIMYKKKSVGRSYKITSQNETDRKRERDRERKKDRQTNRRRDRQ